MNNQFKISRLFLLVLLSLPLTPTAVRAAEPSGTAQVVAVSGSVLADGLSFSRLFSPIESFLGNRRRMIQMAVIGMCIGLYILMRR